MEAAATLVEYHVVEIGKKVFEVTKYISTELNVLQPLRLVIKFEERKTPVKIL